MLEFWGLEKNPISTRGSSWGINLQTLMIFCQPCAETKLRETMTTNIVCDIVKCWGGFPQLADFGSCRGVYSKQPYTEYISTRWCTPPMSWIFPLSFHHHPKMKDKPTSKFLQNDTHIVPLSIAFCTFFFCPQDDHPGLWPQDYVPE